MKVTKYDNILSDELYNELYDYIQILTSTKSAEFTTNITLWNKNIVKNSTPILRYVFSEKENTLFLKLKTELEQKIPYKLNFVMVYLWTNLSYIPWHNDAGYSGGLTIYMNKNWEDDWGGYFIYKDADDLKIIPPKKNTAILQENGVMHMVSTINIGAEHRITLQTFFKKENSII